MKKMARYRSAGACPPRFLRARDTPARDRPSPYGNRDREVSPTLILGEVGLVVKFKRKTDDECKFLFSKLYVERKIDIPLKFRYTIINV